MAEISAEDRMSLAQDVAASMSREYLEESMARHLADDYATDPNEFYEDLHRRTIESTEQEPMEGQLWAVWDLDSTGLREIQRRDEVTAFSDDAAVMAAVVDALHGDEKARLALIVHFTDMPQVRSYRDA